MKTHITPQHIMVALLVGIIAVPLTSTALFLQQDSVETMDMSAQDLLKSAADDRPRLRAQRRLYNRMMEQYQNGRTQVKPMFNDPSTYENVFPSASLEPEEEEEGVVSSLTTDQLETHDRSLLRRYTRAGFCPEGLKNFYIEGFYELCVSLVGQNELHQRPIRGLLNHNAYLYRKLRPSATIAIPPMRLRLQMIEQAHSGQKRDGGVMPMRPLVCVMNPDCLQPRYGY